MPKMRSVSGKEVEYKIEEEKLIITALKNSSEGIPPTTGDLMAAFNGRAWLDFTEDYDRPLKVGEEFSYT